MSMCQEIDLTCPGCGHDGRTTIWTSINVTNDPELKQQFIERKLNFYTCPKCGESGVLPVDFLYDDMDAKFMVYLAYELDDENYPAVADQLNQQVDEMTSRFPMPYQMTLRIAGSENDLREKILIFEAGLDDRAIELMKVGLRVNSEDGLPGMFYFAGETDEGMGFVLIDDQGNEYGLTATREMYGWVITEFKDVLAADNTHYQLVNERWAMRVSGVTRDEQ